MSERLDPAELVRQLGEAGSMRHKRGREKTPIVPLVRSILDVALDPTKPDGKVAVKESILNQPPKVARSIIRELAQNERGGGTIRRVETKLGINRTESPFPREPARRKKTS